MVFVLRKPLRLFFSLSDWSLWSQELCWHHSWWKGSTRFDQSALDFCLRVAALKGPHPPLGRISPFFFITYLKATLRIQLWKCSYNAITNQTKLVIAFCPWALLLWAFLFKPEYIRTASMKLKCSRKRGKTSPHPCVVLLKTYFLELLIGFFFFLFPSFFPSSSLQHTLVTL